MSDSQILRMTARDLLVRTAGDAHQLCTVVVKGKASNHMIGFTCSCGTACHVAASKENKDALRNVPEVKS